MLAVVFILTDTSEGWRRRRRMGSATRVPNEDDSPTPDLPDEKPATWRDPPSNGTGDDEVDGKGITTGS
jgi:hypothetical protein